MFRHFVGMFFLRFKVFVSFLCFFHFFAIFFFCLKLLNLSILWIFGTFRQFKNKEWPGVLCLIAFQFQMMNETCQLAFQNCDHVKKLVSRGKISPIKIAIQKYIQWLTGSMIRFLFYRSIRSSSVSAPARFRRWFLSFNPVRIESSSENNRFSCFAKCVLNLINFELIRNHF